MEYFDDINIQYKFFLEKIIYPICRNFNFIKNDQSERNELIKRISRKIAYYKDRGIIDEYHLLSNEMNNTKEIQEQKKIVFEFLIKRGKETKSSKETLKI